MAANNTTKQKTAGAGEDVQKLGPSYTAGGMKNGAAMTENTMEDPQKVKNRTAT